MRRRRLLAIEGPEKYLGFNAVAAGNPFDRGSRGLISLSGNPAYGNIPQFRKRAEARQEAIRQHPS
jgi:hypothetical protein